MSETNKPATENAIEIEAETLPLWNPIHRKMPAEIDPIEEQFTADCPSISGRSTLTYAIGRHPETGELHLRIVENSGKGMWFDGWASAKDIDAIVKGAAELTAKSFHALHPGKSINTGGFVLAVLKDLGLIRPRRTPASTSTSLRPRSRKWPWCAWVRPLKQR